jgi:predicted small lipoprotein YifL
MRMKTFVCAAVCAAALTGCSKSGPVTVTPEMEAEQKRADQEAHAAESARQKTQKPTGKPTADDEERARSRGQ